MANVTANPPAPNIGFGKSVAAVVAGAATPGVVDLINQFMPQPLPAEITDAIQTLITAAAVYYTPHDAVGGG